MSKPPVVRREHGRDERKRWWEDSSATQRARDTVERVLVRVRVCIICGILRRLAQGKHSNRERPGGGEGTYVRVKPSLRVIFGYLAHAL